MSHLSLSGGHNPSDLGFAWCVDDSRAPWENLVYCQVLPIAHLAQHQIFIFVVLIYRIPPTQVF